MAAFLLLSSRAEIRPEGFSVFFVALDFWLLQRFLQRRISARVLLSGHSHCSNHLGQYTYLFLYGPVARWYFFMAGKIIREIKERLAVLKRLLFISVLVNLINPSGLWGMLTPLNGFKKFGYDLAENQSVFFMIHRFPDNFIYKYFLAAAMVMIIGMVL